MILWFLLSHICGILCIDYENKNAEVYVLLLAEVYDDEPHSQGTKLTFKQVNVVSKEEPQELYQLVVQLQSGRNLP